MMMVWAMEVRLGDEVGRLQRFHLMKGASRISPVCVCVRVSL